MIRFLLQTAFFPFTLLYFAYARLRMLRRTGPVLLHRVPDRFTVFRSSGLLSVFFPQDTAHFVEYMSLLRAIEESKEIETVIAFIPDLHHGFTETCEIAQAFSRIRSTGKKLIAHTEGGGLRTLLLAARADERYAAYGAEFQSFLPASESYYLKGLLSRFGVRIHARTAGKFKSAGEMFSRESSSREARENLESLLDDLRRGILSMFENSPAGASAARKFERKTLWTGEELVSEHFFAGLCSEEDLIEKISGKQFEKRAHPFRQDASPGEEGLRIVEDVHVAREQHFSLVRPLRLRRRRSAAFAALEGTITAGRRGEPIRSGYISANAYRTLLKDLEDTRDEVVFLSINSPGGTPEGSEILYESIRRLGELKPVIALLGGVAASGGYYAASAAHRIFASPLSITGSIGVVRLEPELSGLLKKAGIKSERTGFTGTEDILSVSAPLSKNAAKLVSAQLESTYRQFLDRVARGRGMKPEDVRKFAEGRVYTARQFLETGLIDGILDFHGALDFYRKEAGFDGRLLIHTYPDVRLDLRSFLTERLGARAELPPFHTSLLYSPLAHEISRI